MAKSIVRSPIMRSMIVIATSQRFEAHWERIPNLASDTLYKKRPFGK
jgi:hypothetical protein